MSRKTDIIVAGSGLAGLMAALAAAESGLRVRVLSEGMGCLAISGGCIDLLGYDAEGRRLEDPWSAFASLPADHPYSILGADAVKEALEVFSARMEAANSPVRHAEDANGQPVNFLMPTIMGTLKPTWLFDARIDPEKVEKARNVLVLSIQGYRDCRPKLIISQLRRYKNWGEKNFSALALPAPFREGGRALSALDLAHMADRAQGREWLLQELKGLGEKHDLVLLPPILGVEADSAFRKKAAEVAGCPLLEMLSTPPGVAGMRIREVLVRRLLELGTEFFENARIIGSASQDGLCEKLVVMAAGREVMHRAHAFVIATGGILSGGVELSQGKAREAVLGLDIPVPENVDEWTNPKIFGKHLLTSLGVPVDGDMRAKDGPKNVFFAGRTIGGYDYAAEKSGHGVSLATGWKAGGMAAKVAEASKPAGAGI